MARREKERFSVHADTIQFTIEHKRVRGIVDLTYSRYTKDESREGMQTRFVLLSCWMNPNNTNAAKAYLIPSKRNPMHRQLVEDIKRVGIMNVGSGTGMCLTTDGHLIRYGIKPGSSVQWYDSDSGATVQMYDSKSKALKHLLDHVALQITIGGLNLVSLSRLPDSILVESGYTKVEDLMLERGQPRGVPMWVGGPTLTFGVTAMYGSRRDEALKVRKQFLDLINKAIAA